MVGGAIVLFGIVSLPTLWLTMELSIAVMPVLLSRRARQRCRGARVRGAAVLALTAASAAAPR